MPIRFHPLLFCGASITYVISIPYQYSWTFVCLFYDYFSAIIKRPYCPHSSLAHAISLKSFCSILLKNNSKLGCPEGAFHDDLARNAGISLKLSQGLFWKCHFIRIHPQNYSKLCFNLISLIFLCIGVKSSPFSKILISSSGSTLLLRLKIVSEQK